MRPNAPTIYPAQISRACANFDELGIFQEMPDGYIKVVFRIIKKINLKCPSAAIFASRKTLAFESGKSIETIHRAVRWLEDKGLIEREQKANIGQRGSKSPIHPTQKLIDALGILESKSMEVQVPEKQVAVAQNPHRERLVRVGDLSLPVDLAWLVTCNGMTAPSVCLLMRLAKEAKQRLSEVVMTTKKYLETLHGRELFAYIKKLLSTGKDFGQIAKIATEAEEAEETSTYLKNKAELLDGRSYSTKDGLTKIKVQDGMLEVLREGRRFMAYMSEKFLEGIDAGRMRQCWDEK